MSAAGQTPGNSFGRHGRMCSVCPARLCVPLLACSLPECLKGNGKQGQTYTAYGWAGINAIKLKVVELKWLHL